MRVIDSHVHLYPPVANADPAAWAQAHGEPVWAQLCTRRRKSGVAVQGFPSVDELLREMDRSGVERSVLLGWYWQRPDTCAWQNRFYAECVRRHPDRLAAFAAVPLDAGSEVAVAEMRRARDDGLRGLGELSPQAHGGSIAAPALPAVLALAGEWRWPVNLHVTDPNSREFPGRVQTPLEDFLTLARRFPAVTFILAHWGGLLPLRDPAALALPNVHYDTAASPLLYDDSIWRRMLAVLPPERVLFGSDFPLNVYPRFEAEPGMSRLIAEAVRAGAPSAVLRDNAARLLAG